MDSAAFEEALRAMVRASLKAAETSLDVRMQEPSLVELVRLVSSSPGRVAQADRLLAELVPSLRETPPPYGLVELLSYCVHTLELPEVLASAHDGQREALAELSRGKSRRPLERARHCEHVIEAASPDWEDREMFESLA
jgi:hypothetical protein